MGYYIDCFKSYEINNMLDYRGEYELKMLDECNGDYIYPSTLSKINDYLKICNLKILYTLIPSFNAEDSFENITKEEAENIAKRFIEPSKCIEYVKENMILQKIKDAMPKEYEEMLFVLENLVNKWQEGYYVYESY